MRYPSIEKNAAPVACDESCGLWITEWRDDDLFGIYGRPVREILYPPVKLLRTGQSREKILGAEQVEYGPTAERES